MNGEVSKLPAIQDMLRKIEKQNHWEQLYVSGSIYGYKTGGKWYEVGKDGIVREV